MRRRFVMAAAVLALWPRPGLSQELTRIDGAWSRYLNARFGTSVDVPNAFRLADPPPANGDGRTFKAADGAELRVFGSYSATTVTENFREYESWILDRLAKDGVAVTYKAQGKDWLVAAGTKGREIVYLKTIEGCGATHELWLTYSIASQRTYGPLIGHLGRSLHCVP